MRFATPRVITALMLREMTTTYGRKPGGYIWSILEPVAGIALMSWIFTAAGARHPGLGTNFPIFYATGLLPLFAYLHLNSRVMLALSYSRQLLAYPRVTVTDALAARFLVGLITELLVAYIVLAGILMLMDTGTHLILHHVVLGFAMAAALAAGTGVLNCFLNHVFPVWGSVWGLFMRPMIFVSGALILLDALPQEWQRWLVWNPLVHIIAEVRKGFYHGYTPAYVSPAFVFGIALVCGVVGLLLVWRTHRDLLEN
ncbi:sugar ABC transporter permease [Rubellimicrobium roseum]|uniref:Transport permease protein n=2 Tax=Rubellimicrobium roseum TaxID=687525 RepID=A0A5C4NLM5_9RHOB|nr:sugar ABC transporter permease [Rubellimicrobium roseum]